MGSSSSTIRTPKILSQVGIVGNCFLHPLNETRSLDRHALVQFILKRRVTRGGHGELSHRFLLSVTADRLHYFCHRATSSAAPPAAQDTKKLHLAMMLCTPTPRDESSSVSPYLRVGIGTPNIRVDRFLRFAVRFRLVFFALRFLAMWLPLTSSAKLRVLSTDKGDQCQSYSSAHC
jgi:hypothetical protein